MKRTPLYAAHQKLGARLIEFGGWEMPVFYTSIAGEHLATRTAAGIFDISHMGEVRARGAAAAEFLNFILANDLRKLRPGLGQYTLLCNPRGGVVDDLYLYQLGPEEFLLVINASRIEADTAWMRARLADFPKRAAVELADVSEALGAVAVQGPKAAAFIDNCFAAEDRPSRLKKNEMARAVFSGREALVSRTGYTGEDGFEIVAPAEVMEALWNRLLEVGRPHGLEPAGLGARDTLRTEACLPLYGHELDEETTPLEAGLGFFVGLEKGDFIGRAALLDQKTAGLSRKLAAFKMQGRTAPPRAGYPIWAPGGPTAMGRVTSGTQSPSLGIGIGLGYVSAEFARPQTPVEIEIRGQKAQALIAPRPIYRRPSDEKGFQAAAVPVQS